MDQRTHFPLTSSPTPLWRAEALARRIESITPAEAARLVPVAFLVSALLSIGVVGVHRLLQLPSPPDVRIVSWALLVCVIAMTYLVAVPREVSFSLPSRVSSDGFTAYVLALECGILLIPVAVFMAVWRNRYDELTGWSYPFLNKRWLVALYGLAIATFLIFPSMIDRLRRSQRKLSVDDTEDAMVSNTAVSVSNVSFKVRPFRWLQFTAGVTVAVSIAWFLVGPPWHVERVHRPIDTHEQVHLGPLQAIYKGYVPYIGPASTQYGPGSQVITYVAMRLSGQFDVVSFRNAQLGIHFAAFTIVAVFAYLTLGFWAMLLIVWLGVAYSPLTLFHASENGTMVGMYGWGNALRNLGPLLVVPTLARVALMRRDHSGLIWPALQLGLLWGIFAWLSQENLGSTLVGGILLLLLLWLSGTLPLNAASALATNVVAGFVVVWSAILGYYAFHGAARAFVRNYFLVASAVAMGFSNSWWPEGDSPGLLNAYYFTGPLAVAVGVASLTEVRSLSLRRRLDGSQVQLLAFVCVLLACYQTALYRSDSAHLWNPMVALPFVIFLTTRDLPTWSARTWLGRASVRIGVAALILYVYPISLVLLDPYNSVVAPAITRFGAQPPLPDVMKDGRVAFRRATRYLSDEPHAGPGMAPMRTFLEGISEIGELVGNRSTYVDAGIAGAYTDLVYFILDLKPGPFLFERETMIIHNGLADEAFEHFQRHVGEFEAIIAPGLGSREVRTFLATYPKAVTIEKRIGDERAFVILANPSS